MQEVFKEFEVLDIFPTMEEVKNAFSCKVSISWRNQQFQFVLDDFF
ncbi:MAG: hypothetical protein ABFC18_04095 [Rikenellaceae bacterium]|jgi:hypothetical protein